MNNMKTKVWLNLDPQKVDVSYLYKKFDEIGCDFEAEAIPDNNPELLIKKVKDVDIVIATMEPWNETTLGAVKGKVKFIQKYGTYRYNQYHRYYYRSNLPKCVYNSLQSQNNCPNY